MSIGLLVEAFDYWVNTPGAAPSTYVHSFPSVTLHDEAPRIEAAGLAHTVLSIESRPLVGDYVSSFFDDWYFRIHIVPNGLDFGNVVTDQSREVLIWNAYLSPRPLSAVSFPIDGGIGVTQPVGAPYSMGSLEMLSYQVTVQVEGPPLVSGGLQWTIDGVTYGVAAAGRRLIIWPFGPNWSGGIAESFDWMTDVFTSYSGNEQRISLRSKPRRSFEYSTWVKGAEAALLRNLLWGWQNRNYALPLWADRTELGAPAANGEIMLTVATSNRGFFPGGLLAIVKGAFEYEVVEILEVEDGQVVLARGLERSWEALTDVFPVNICRMPTTVSSRRLTDSVEEVSIVFDADPTQTNPMIPSAPAQEVLAGREVVLRKPNWARPVDIQSHFEYNLIDFSVGAVLADPTREFAQVSRRFQWVLKSKAEVDDFKALLGRLKGRQTPVYLPTWFEDFQLHEEISAANVSVPVKDNAFRDMVGYDSAQGALMILVKGASPIIRQIDVVGTNSAGDTVLQLTEEVGVDLTFSSVKRLSLVHLCRLASDRVTVNWVSDSVATVEATFITVRE